MKIMPNKNNWNGFQEDIRDYLESLGVSAETNKTVCGVRTKHDVDIFARTKFLGQDVAWIIEAKYWRKKVNKVHVLALRAIAEDVGVDRAFIISSKGFQKGAFEAAKNSNVKLKTFEELKEETKEYLQTELIKMHRSRLRILEVRYWSHSKSKRQEYGLRGFIWDYPINFDGQGVIRTAHIALNEAEKGRYPIDLSTYHVEAVGEREARSFQELENWLNLNLNYLDSKIIEAEFSMIKNDDFKPDICLLEENEVSTIEMMASVMSAPSNEEIQDMLKKFEAQYQKKAIKKNQNDR